MGRDAFHRWVQKNLHKYEDIFIPKLFFSLRDYSSKQFRSDLSAGVVVGLVALPLGMAFAIASGLPPERGLYTAIVAGFLISLLGGSRVQIGGPTGAFVVIVGGVAAQHGYEGLAIATLMAGCILFLMGLGRLGTLIKFIPVPVITGFTSGIAVIIFSGQIKDFLGLQMDSVPLDFIEKWRAYGDAIGSLNGAAFLIGLSTTLLIFFWPKKWQRFPASIVALVLATLVVEVFRLPVETIHSRFGDVPHGLPFPEWPSVSWEKVKLLFPSALTIAALGAIESLLSAVVADGMIGSRHRSNQELLAQGIANITTPFFGGFAATGAIARTATNVKNGARTPIAGITHAIVLLIILLVAGPLASLVPLAALTGVLIVVSYHMSEWRSFRFLLSGTGSDKLVLLATFFLTVFVDLVVAVEVGMVLAAFLFMKNMAELTEVKAFTKEMAPEGGEDLVQDFTAPPGVEVFSIRGAFFFAAVHKMMEVDRIVAKTPHALVLDMGDVIHMDMSGLHVLERLHQQCRARKIRFILSGLHSQPYQTILKANKVDMFGKEHIKRDLKTALRDLSSPAPKSVH
ncbi:MAG: C4-dicarboxylic acid transporter DauA [Elusimicrobia bacterium]|nr:C4-dicarboxylic acid transporter DauA [Elusimicrobiota bacterium]